MIDDSEMKLDIDMQWNFYIAFPQRISFWPPVWNAIALEMSASKILHDYCTCLVIKQVIKSIEFYKPQNLHCFNIYYPDPEKGPYVHCILGSYTTTASGKHKMSISRQCSEIIFIVLYLLKKKGIILFQKWGKITALQIVT